MTTRRCPSCREWHDKREPECPNCGTPRYGFSSHLYTAKLNSHLFESAARVEANR